MQKNISEKNILFYYPSNKNSNVLETIITSIKNSGYPIIVLTTCEEGDFHKSLKIEGIKVYTHQIPKKWPIIYYIKQIVYLVRFCHKQKVNVVLSHLQHANIISVFAQYFTKARFIIFRHQFRFQIYSEDKSIGYNRNELLFDNIINRLSKIQIVPSNAVLKGMIEHEKANSKKIRVLPYIYDFNKYKQPNPNAVNLIKEKYPCKLRLIMCCRLVASKRHMLVLKVAHKLIQEEHDIQLLILDEGPEKNTITNFIKKNNLNQRVHLIGYTNDFSTYMSACDLMIHPSLSEASNSAVKEMGYFKGSVAVCEKVGDFDEYIKNDFNGFIMPLINTEQALEKIVREAYTHKEKLKEMGENLHQTVIKKFSSRGDILKLYLDLLK